LIAKINNPVILGILFFFFLTPTAVVMRLLKRDELKIKMKKTSTYWAPYEKIEFNESYFKNLF